MSQSNLISGFNTPKDSARTRRDRNDSEAKTETGEEKGPEPACRSRSIGHSADKREWREVRYIERRLTCYRPCTWPECFPSGSPDPNEIETVIRSSHCPTVYHRPREGGSADCDSVAQSQATVEHESVTTITDLREGEAVVWEGQRWSMYVAETATKPDGVARLAGPNGGTYRIEGRPDKTQSYAVYPGVGVVAELYRIVAEDRPQLEAV
jgi:hypothetical protein